MLHYGVNMASKQIVTCILTTLSYMGSYTDAIYTIAAGYVSCSYNQTLLHTKGYCLQYSYIQLDGQLYSQLVVWLYKSSAVWLASNEQSFY